MPNHVTNILTVSGDPKRMAELFDAIKTEKKVTCPFLKYFVESPKYRTHAMLY